jgi:hypothetical protein
VNTAEKNLKNKQLGDPVYTDFLLVVAYRTVKLKIYLMKNDNNLEKSTF